MTRSGATIWHASLFDRAQWLTPVADGAPVGGCRHAQLQRRLPGTKQPFEGRALVSERAHMPHLHPARCPSDQQGIMLTGPGGELLGVADAAEGSLGVGVTQQSLEDEQGRLV
jgi:hypothetical protein